MSELWLQRGSRSCIVGTDIAANADEVDEYNTTVSSSSDTIFEEAATAIPDSIHLRILDGNKCTNILDLRQKSVDSSNNVQVEVDKTSLLSLFCDDSESKISSKAHQQDLTGSTNTPLPIENFTVTAGSYFDKRDSAFGNCSNNNAEDDSEKLSNIDANVNEQEVDSPSYGNGSAYSEVSLNLQRKDEESRANDGFSQPITFSEARKTKTEGRKDSAEALYHENKSDSLPSSVEYSENRIEEKDGGINTMQAEDKDYLAPDSPAALSENSNSCDGIDEDLDNMSSRDNTEEENDRIGSSYQCEIPDYLGKYLPTMVDLTYDNSIQISGAPIICSALTDEISERDIEWSTEEKQLFEKAIYKHGADFSSIAKFINYHKNLSANKYRRHRPRAFSQAKIEGASSEKKMNNQTNLVIRTPRGCTQYFYDQFYLSRAHNIWKRNRRSRSVTNERINVKKKRLKMKGQHEKLRVTARKEATTQSNSMKSLRDRGLKNMTGFSDAKRKHANSEGSTAQKRRGKLSGCSTEKASKYTKPSSANSSAHTLKKDLLTENEKKYRLNDGGVRLKTLSIADSQDKSKCCVCIGNDEKGGRMVTCVSCLNWYHYVCVGLRKDMISGSSRFSCANCSPTRDGFGSQSPELSIPGSWKVKPSSGKLPYVVIVALEDLEVQGIARVIAKENVTKVSPRDMTKEKDTVDSLNLQDAANAVDAVGVLPGSSLESAIRFYEAELGGLIARERPRNLTPKMPRIDTITKIQKGQLALISETPSSRAYTMVLGLNRVPVKDLDKDSVYLNNSSPIVFQLSQFLANNRHIRPWHGTIRRCRRWDIPAKPYELEESPSPSKSKDSDSLESGLSVEYPIDKASVDIYSPLKKFNEPRLSQSCAEIGSVALDKVKSLIGISDNLSHCIDDEDKLSEDRNLQESIQEKQLCYSHKLDNKTEKKAAKSFSILAKRKIEDQGFAKDCLSKSSRPGKKISRSQRLVEDRKQASIALKEEANADTISSCSSSVSRTNASPEVTSSDAPSGKVTQESIEKLSDMLGTGNFSQLDYLLRQFVQDNNLGIKQNISDASFLQGQCIENFQQQEINSSSKKLEAQWIPAQSVPLDDSAMSTPLSNTPNVQLPIGILSASFPGGIDYCRSKRIQDEYIFQIYQLRARLIQRDFSECFEEIKNTEAQLNSISRAILLHSLSIDPKERLGFVLLAQQASVMNTKEQQARQLAQLAFAQEEHRLSMKNGGNDAFLLPLCDFQQFESLALQHDHAAVLELTHTSYSIFLIECLSVIPEHQTYTTSLYKACAEAAQQSEENRQTKLRLRRELIMLEMKLRSMYDSPMELGAQLSAQEQLLRNNGLLSSAQKDASFNSSDGLGLSLGNIFRATQAIENASDILPNVINQAASSGSENMVVNLSRANVPNIALGTIFNDLSGRDLQSKT